MRPGRFIGPSRLGPYYERAAVVACPSRREGYGVVAREAIARSIGLMSRLRTPIVTVITGEGGSGGALAIAVAAGALLPGVTAYAGSHPSSGVRFTSRCP